MKLIFHDRSVSPAVSLTDALLTIERKGNFSLSTGAVAGLQLTPKSQVVLVEDVETNTWYLLLAPLAGQEPFSLKPRDSKSSKALMFCCLPQAKAYYQAHGLLDEKSVRALIGLAPVHHEGLALYPLAPQHATPAICAPIAPAEAPAFVPAAAAAPAGIAPAPARSTSMFTAEMDEALLDPNQLVGTLSEVWAIPVASLYARRSYLKKRAGGTATTEPAAPVATPAEVSAATATPAAPANETPDERMERLTDYWFEREIKECPEAELTELVSLLADKPKKQRDIVENQMLNRGKTELERRKKNGGNRG